MKKKAAIAVLVLLTLLAVLMVRQSHKRPAEGVIVASGNVEVTEVNAGFTLAGRIEQLLAEEGQRTNKGDRLGVLDGAEAELQVSRYTAALSEARTRTDALKAGSRQQEVGQARAEVSSAEAELSKAEKDLERSDSLHKNGAISDQQLDEARKNRDTAFARHRKALEKLSLVKEGPRAEDIKAAESAAAQAAAALKIAEERLKDTVIYAPLSGVILRKNREAGEVAAAGVPVYTIGDLGHPWIKVYVREERLGLVKLGQRAEITTDSYPGKKYEGTVTYISSDAEFTPKNVQTQEERVKMVFGVKVSVKNSNEELKPGMPADVRIFLK